MKKEIVIHMGTPKTGSSAIQEFLFINRTLLREKGIHYPDTGKGINVVGNAGVLLNQQKRMYLSATEAVQSMVPYCEGNIILFTAESFWHRLLDKKSFLLGLKERGFVVKVVVYLRKQIDYIESLYRHYIKLPSSLTLSYQEMFDEVLSLEKEEAIIAGIDDSGIERNELERKALIFHSAHYWEMIKEITDVIGVENICVRRYGKEYFKGGSIFADFLAAIGMEGNMSGYVLPHKRINPTLGYEEAQIQIILNQLKNKISFEELSAIHKIVQIESALFEKSFQMETAIPNDVRKHIMERYAEGNRLLARTFFDGEVLFKEDDLNNMTGEKEDILPALVRMWGLSVVVQQRKLNKMIKVLQMQQERIDKMLVLLNQAT